MAALLLLLEDVEDLGLSGDVVKVKPGYARNYLLPRGFAVVADKNALRMQEKLKEERKLKAAQDKKESEELAHQLETVVLDVSVKVDQEGHMYGSVSALDIAHLLQEKKGLELDKHHVLLKRPIRELGEHLVELKLKEGVIGKFTLRISAEGQEQTAAQEKASTAE